MNRPVALAVVGLALLAALLLPLRAYGEPGTQATTQGYEWEVLPGIQREQTGATTARLRITDDWHSSPEAIDLVPQARGTLDRCLPTATETSLCETDPVHAAFRRAGPGQDHTVTFTALNAPDSPSCKGVLADIRDSANRQVAVVRYTHVIQSIGHRTTTTLSALAASPALVGTLTIPHPDNDVLLADIEAARIDAEEHPDNQHKQDVHAEKVRLRNHYVKLADLAAHKAKLDGAKCPNTGVHLHQAVAPGDTGVVQQNRDNSDANKGISAAWTCISSSMWLWKLASSTPAITATNAPTTTCPSTLTVQTAATVGSAIVHGGTVVLSPLEGPYVANEPVTLTAMAKTGFRFTAWSGDVGTGCAGASSCTVTMDQDRTVRADFGIELTVRITAGGRVTVTETLTGGTANTATPWSATCDASCSLAVPLTVQRLTVTATADDGYQLSEWGGACAGTAVTEPCTVTLNTRAANPSLAISATFAADTPPFPEIIHFGLNEEGTALAVRFTWDGAAPHYLTWTLARAADLFTRPTEGESITITAKQVADHVAKSETPSVAFKQQTLGWYEVRGRVCRPNAQPVCSTEAVVAGTFALLKPPTGAQVTGVTATTATVTVTPPAGVTGYGFEGRVNAAGNLRTIRRAPSADAPRGASADDSAAISYQFTGLEPGTTYTLFVRSTSSDGGLSFWRTVSVKTLAAPSTPTVTIAADVASVTEGQPATFTLTRTGGTGADLAVKVGVSESGSMIKGTAPTSVRIPKGSATGTLSVATHDDAVDEQNSVITATVTAGTGYAPGDPASATVTVTDDDCTLTVTAGSGGSTTPSDTSTHDCGTSHDVTATANTGYQFDEWSGDSTSTSASITITLNGNKSVHAEFEIGNCDLTVTAGPGGTASGGGTYKCFTRQDASATANAGYQFDRWSGDASGSANPLDIYLDRNKSVHAHFKCGPAGDPPDPETEARDVGDRFRWVMSGVREIEEKADIFQDYTRSATYNNNVDVCAYQWGPWVKDGEPYLGPFRATGNRRCKAPGDPPDPETEPRDIGDEFRWVMSGVMELEEKADLLQNYTRSATFNNDVDVCAYEWGPWVKDGNPYLGPFTATGNRRCKTPLATKPSGSKSERVGNPSYGWDVRGTTPNRVAHQQKNEQKQNYTWETDWADVPTCGWVNGKWVKDGAPSWTGWKDTGITKAEPPLPPNVERVRVGDPQKRWVTEPGGGFCIRYEEQRQLYRTTIYSNQSYVWRAPNWVLQRTPLFQGTTYSAWTRTGRVTACALRSDGVQGASATPVTLAAGDYTLPWDLQRITFTVPAKTSVTLEVGARADGEAVVVLRAGEAALTLHPDALADGARPAPTAANTTLAAIAASLVLTTVELVATPPAADESCAVVPAAASGATAVDLDASLCAEVPAGALSVTLGGQTLSLTLPTGHDWLLLRVAPDPAVVGIIDTASGAYLALNAATGAEQSREVEADVTVTIGPLFDAIAKSAQPPAAEDDSS